MLTVRATGTQITAFNNLSRSSSQLGKTTHRLATGLRINSGSDDPAGLVAAENLRGDLVEISARAKTIGYERHELRVEQSGRQQATSLLHDLRGLVAEAAGNTVTPDQKQAIQTQIDSALDGLDFVAKATGFEPPSGLDALRSGNTGNVVDGNPAAAADVLDEQRAALTSASAAAGAYEKYTLDVNQRLAEDQAVVAAQALSEIADADYAEEASNLTRAEITFRASLKTVGLLNSIRGEGLLTLLGAK